MSKPYKNTFEQFASMAEQVIEEGAPLLEAYFEHGDWMLLVTNRHVLDDAELSPKDYERLRKLDKGIARSFTPTLLKEYAFLEEAVNRWWGADHK